MSIIELIVLGIGLAMDAVAVSMTNGMVYKYLKARDYALMPILFGVFQSLMPLIGYYAGNIFEEIITRYGGIVIFIILGVIGGKMVWGSFHHDGNDEKAARQLTIGILSFQAVATSIDAFAVGVGFCAIKVDILPAIGIIGIVTAIMVTGAIFIGKKFGDIFESKAEIIGGIILIIIGIKALF